MKVVRMSDDEDEYNESDVRTCLCGVVDTPAIPQAQSPLLMLMLVGVSGDWEEERITFRRRVFSSSLDGKPIRGKNVETMIKSEEFKKLDDNDAVSLCYVGILQLFLLALEDRRPVPNWILRLANDREGWDKYSWGSHVTPPFSSISAEGSFGVLRHNITTQA
ncbi:hypothetical protein Tco_0826969 [Tanacetum coccineum]